MSTKPGAVHPLTPFMSPNPRQRLRLILSTAAVVLLSALTAYAARAPLREALSNHYMARGDYRTALRWNVYNAQARLQLARLELDQRQPEHAYLELRTLTELQPQLASAWIELAQLMQTRGLLEEPEAALTQALEAEPANADALKLRGTLRYHLGAHYSAALDMRRWFATQPAKPENTEVKARLEAALARPADLPALLRGLLPPAPGSTSPTRSARDEERFDGGLPRERWPGQLALLRQQLQAALQKQDLKAAQALAAQARQAYPDTIYGPWLQGIVQLAQRDHAAAEHSLHQALALAPRSQLVITGLTKIWVQTKGADYAGAQLLKMAEADPELGFALRMAAVAYLKGRQPAKAEAALRRGLQRHAQSPKPYRELARFFLELDRAGDALFFCDQGLQRAPQDAPLLGLRARIAAQLKDKDGAIAAYEKHLAAQPDSQDSRAALARLLVTHEDQAARTRALYLLATLEVDAPANASVQGAIGWVYAQAGQTASALQWLKLAALNAPDDPAIRYHLASAYAQGKDVTAAKAELKRALDSERPFAERLEAQRLARALE